MPRQSYLVTGASGFIGARVARLLYEKGSDVLATGRRKVATRISDLPIDYVAGDLMDDGFLREVVAGAGAVIHLAAAGTSWGAEEAFSELVEANTVATYRLILAAGEAGASKVVIAGTQAEFGEASGTLGVDARISPATSYGFSKAAALLAAPIAGKAAGVETTGLRIPSAYGPGDTEHRFIPNVILCGLRGEPVKMTTGEQARDFTYVDDIACAFVAAANIEWGEHRVFNLGTGRGLRLREAAEIVAECLGSEVDFQFGALPYREGEPMHLVADPANLPPEIRKCLSTVFEDGVAATVAWYRDHAQR